MNTDAEGIKLLQSLGAGAFGQTYMVKVLDKKLLKDQPLGKNPDSIAVIKVPVSKEKEIKLIKELINNASLHSLLKGVRSKYIVDYLGFILFRDKYVMLMEYVEKGNLRSLLGGDVNQKKALTKDKALAVMNDIARGVAVIHGYNMVHNDLKPENILIGKDAVKIADLGLAQIHSPDALTSYPGTLPYMAPEVLKFKRSALHSDIWSLGVIFYEIATGMHPFIKDGISPEELQAKIISGEFIPPEDLNKDIEPAIAGIIRKCMQLNPSKRYATAKELSEALEKLGAEETKEVEKKVLEINHALKEGAITFAEAEKRLEHLKTLYPDDVRVYVYIGEFYNLYTHYADAIRALEGVIKNKTKDPLVYWTVAYSYQGIDQKGKAIFYLEKAIECGLDANLKRHAMFLINRLRENR